MRFTFQDCHVTRAGNDVTIANNRIERTWRITPQGLQAVSLRSIASGEEWLLAEDGAVGAMPYPGGIDPAVVTLTAQETTLTATGAPALGVTLVVPCAAGAVTHRFWIVPEMPAVTQQVTFLSGAKENLAQEGDVGQAPSGIEADPVRASSRQEADLCESWRMKPHHLSLRQIGLMDRTDGHDNLLHETVWHLSPVEKISLKGCLFTLENPLTRAGLILLKHAPLPHVRPAPCECDLFAHHREVRLLGHGAGESGEGYAWTTALYEDGAAGMTRSLQGFQQALRVYRPGLDGLAVSNTWGDRNRDGALSESFMKNEFAVAGRMGIDVCQIDDGWQRGVSSNSTVAKERGGVWEGYYASDPAFWTMHPERFPDGLAAVAAQAQAAGVRLGLWFGPDSAHDFENWEKDVETLLGLYRDHGVRWIKIDSVKSRTKLGEGRLKKLFDRVLRESGGNVVFDLDVTAEVRPGYFGLPEIGPLFVENRYTDWGRWWPHATLRNLWQLSRVIHPVRLRMEWLNALRNEDKYANDPLAPASYDPAYVLATILVASPLFWCELSKLPKATVDAVTPLLKIWKQYREELHTGAVIPIGDCPDGGSFTGFLCHNPGRRVAHVLAFREHTPQAQAELLLPCALPGNPVRLAGSGEWRGEAGRQSATVSFPDVRQFGWWRWDLT